MLTLRSAAGLLASCDDPGRLRSTLAQLGFSGEPLPVGSALRTALALGEEVDAAEIVRGRGALRACALHVRDGAPAAERVLEFARRVAARAPHGLWLVAGVQHTPPVVVLAVPAATAAAPIGALILLRTDVVDSDAETFASMASAQSGEGTDLVVHARWSEILGRDALNRRFYRVLDHCVRGLADDARGGRTAADRAEVALLCSSRLLFLAFLQAKGWLDGDRTFLARIYESCTAAAGDVHRRVLRPLFFGTLNTPRYRRAPAARAFGSIPFLNGGLFAPARVERGPRAPVLGDAALGTFLTEVLGGYRFTAREDRATWADAAVDPEMLGRAFESLMASRERRASGTFYTPSSLVERIADRALVESLEGAMPLQMRGTVAALAAGDRAAGDAQAALLHAISSLTVLDPACGSGAFLVHVLTRLSCWRERAGDLRPPDTIRRELLAHSIFGIDRDPIAVWLCELRLWLAVAVECEESDPGRVLPLPNLDRNIRVGDALSALHGDAGSSATWRPCSPVPARVAELRARYARATGARKRAAAESLDAAERRVALLHMGRALELLGHRRRDILAARRGRDLFGARLATAALTREAATLRRQAARLRRERQRLLGGGALPFHYEAHFADVFAAGGFSTVLGNPPWVRLHRVPPSERESLRARFAVLRHAAWTPGALAGGAGGGFAGQADLASLFVERSLEVLRPGGTLALLLPAKLWTALAGGGVRRVLRASARLLALEDCSEAPELFDAVTYPSILLARRAGGDDAQPEVELSVHRGDRVARWRSSPAAIAWDDTAGSPWLLLPPPARAAFDRMRQAGRSIAESGFGRPAMGVKCGHNDAFLVHATCGVSADEAAHSAATPVAGATRVVQDRAGRRGAVECALLRPAIRGEHVQAWRITRSAEHIIWTHGDGGVLRTLPPHAARWLAPHRARLCARTDVRGRQPWWSLHRVDGAHSRQARVIWADMARTPRAAWLDAGDPAVPLNTCYVLHCASTADAQAFVALLNSPLAAAWLRAVAEPARGGYRRLFAWTMALLPLPADWPRARAIFAPLALASQASSDGSADPPGEDLLDAALEAYRLRRRDLAPLLEWLPTALP